MGRSITLWVVALVLCGSGASAQIRDESASMTFTGGGYIFASEEELSPTPVMGVRLGFDMIEHLGVEGSFNFGKARSDDLNFHIDAYQYRIDALLYLMPKSWFVPYLSAGGGVLQTIGLEGAADSAAPVMDYGVGVKMFVADSVALRLEGRHYAIFDVDRRFNYEGTFGINYYFGRGKKEKEGRKETAELIQSEKKEIEIVAEEKKEAQPALVTAASSAPPADDKILLALAQCQEKLAAAQQPVLAVSGEPASAAKADPPKSSSQSSGPVAAETSTAVPAEFDTVKSRESTDEMTCEVALRFKPGSSRVDPRYHDEVMKLADLMKFYAKANVTLEGFGDGKVGTKAYKSLALKRATSVGQYMSYHFGIPVKRIKPIPATTASTKGTIRVTVVLEK